MTNVTKATRQNSQVVDAYPISRMQLGMIAESDRGSDRSVYWDEAQLVLRGAFNPALFERAVETTIATHPALRTTFDLSGFSVPVQLVHDVPPYKVISTGDDANTHDFNERLGRPFRIRVDEEAKDRVRVTIGFHHAVMDGWSLSVLTSELLTTYDALLDGREPAMAAPEALPSTFVALELEASADEGHRRHWMDRIEPFRRQALAYPEPGTSSSGTSESPVELVLGADKVDQLASLAAAQGIPLRSLLFSIHLGALSLAGENGRACTGYVSNGRPESDDATRGVGVFLNTLPLSADVHGHSWRTLADHVHATLRENERYRRFPLGAIADAAPWFSGFETFVDYRDFSLYGAEHSHFSVSESVFTEQTEIPLSVAYRRSRENGTIGVRALFDGRRLRREWVESLLTAIAAAVESVISNPDHRVEESELVSVDAAQSKRASTSLDDLVFGLSSFGSARAVEDMDGAISYAELDVAANAIAAELRAAGVCDGTPVALAIRRSRRHVMAMLGALRARSPFVPLNTDHPAERIQSMLETAQCSWVLTDSPTASVPGTRVADGVWLERATTANDRGDRLDGELDGAAYVLFTSGSTGAPKGVVVTRANLSALLDGVADRVRLEPGDRALASTAFTFDISLVELLLPLAVGASIVVSEHGWDKPEAIANLVDEGELRFMQATPSCWRLLLDVLRSDQLPMIAVTAGEVLHTDLAARLVQRFEHVLNGYGPTEATIYTTMAHVAVPPFDGIGTALEGVGARVVDPSTQRAMPLGMLGELWLSGAYLSPGYIGQPEETAKRFIEHRGTRWYRTGDLALRTDPATFQVVGRIDNQVKIDGVRIELEEVEAAVERQPGVEASVCVIEGDGAVAGSGARIIALVQLAEGYDVTTSAVQQGVRALLPESMVPAAVCAVTRIPVSSAGKKDRRAVIGFERKSLAAAPEAREDRALSDDETAMLSIFREVFGNPEIQLETRFRDAGGTSMLALRIRMAVWQQLERELTVGVLFSNPSVAEAAATIRDEKRDPGTDQVVALNGPVEGRTLLLLHPLGGEVGAYLDLATSLEGSWQILAVQAPEFVGGSGEQLTTIEEISAEYRRIVDAANLPPITAIGGWCMGATLAYEMWRQWAEEGRLLPPPLLISGSISEPVPVAYATDDVAALLGAFGWRGRVDEAELACMTKSSRYDRVLELVLEQDSTRPGVREHEELDRLVSLYHRHAVALIDYTATGPRWIPDAVLIRAEDEAWDGTFGWEEWVDELLPIVLPGAHDTLLEAPYLEGLRLAIDGHLKTAGERAIA